MKTKKKQQGVVRRGQLEQTLEVMNQEMRQKVLDSLYDYHNDFIEPRLSRLEMPWWRRIFTKKPDPYKKTERPPTAEEMYAAYDKQQEEQKSNVEAEIPEH